MREIAVRGQHARVVTRDAERRPTGRGREPARDPARVVQPVDVLQQVQPRGLEDVRGVGVAEAVGAGDRPDHAAVGVDERVPRRGVTRGGAADEVGRVGWRQADTVTPAPNDGIARRPRTRRAGRARACVTAARGRGADPSLRLQICSCGAEWAPRLTAHCQSAVSAGIGRQPVRIAILGDLAVFDDEDRPVAVQGRNQRTLLASLATRPGTVVSADVLVEAIWERRPPANAANAVQTVVSRLRSALGDGVVLTRPPGYVLGVAAGRRRREPVRAAGRRGAPSAGGRGRRRRPASCCARPWPSGAARRSRAAATRT